MRKITNNIKSLKDIIGDLKEVEILGDPHTKVSGITQDSRKITQGDLYICIPGLKVDGHKFAEDAVRAGAAALVVERYLDIDVPQIKVKKARDVGGYLAAAFYNCPSRQLELVGVTGTNGKTTVSHLIERIARRSGKKTGLIGTLGAKIGEKIIHGQLTTPEAPEIQRLLADMVANRVETAAMEVSSHALSLSRVKGCVYSAAVFTNLSQDHLDYHSNMREYLETKARLFSSLKENPEKQYAIINSDDPSYEYLKQKTACRIMTYGLEGNPDFKAENIRLSSQGVEFEVRYNSLVAEVRYKTPGKFSVYNALAAMAWGLTGGYSLDTVLSALNEIEGVPGRFESLRFGQPFTVIVDYAHTPAGLENVLQTAKEVTDGKLITVFGCGGDRDRSKRPIMGQVAGELSDFTIVTSDNPRTENPREIIEDILPGLKKTGVSPADYKIIEDRREAIGYACSLATRGDTVVIAGKGHEDYQIIGTEKIHFSDQEEVIKALRGLGYVG